MCNIEARVCKIYSLLGPAAVRIGKRRSVVRENGLEIFPRRTLEFRKVQFHIICKSVCPFLQVPVTEIPGESITIRIIVGRILCHSVRCSYSDRIFFGVIRDRLEFELLACSRAASHRIRNDCARSGSNILDTLSDLTEYAGKITAGSIIITCTGNRIHNFICCCAGIKANRIQSIACSLGIICFTDSAITVVIDRHFMIVFTINFVTIF